MGYNLYYDSRLNFTHFMNFGRLDWKWYVNFFKNAAFNSYLFDPYEKAAHNTNLANRLRRTALYEIYISIRQILKANFSLKYLLYQPQPYSSKEWFECYYQKHRIFGLLTCINGYKRLVDSVSEAKWLKK